jgi:hypothetical protein
VGTPFFIGRRTILCPVRKARFHEPCSTTKASPEYSAGNLERPLVAS